MKRIYFMILALLTLVGGVNAKTKTTKVLWEGTYSKHIEISKDKLAVGTLTVYMSWAGSDGTQVRAYYKKNDKNWTESKFSENSGTIEDYKWQSNGTASYEISIAESDMTILNDNREEIGSRGILYIGSADATKMKITMITLTTTSSETETRTTSVWSGTHDLDNYSGLNLTGETYKSVLKDAKIGDILRATYTADEAGYINFCNGSGWTTLIGGSFSVTATSENATVEYEITSATVLEAIQQNGIVMNGTNAVLSNIDLLTYSTSYDAVSVTIGSDEVATFSSAKDLDFTASGLSVYYASAVTTGLVTLTKVDNNTTWNYQGYILKGAEGTYTIPVTKSATWPGTDYLRAHVSEGLVYRSVYSGYEGEGEEADKIRECYRYIFAKDNSDGKIAFFKLTSDYTLAAHRAYLETETDITPSSNQGGARLVLRFEDEDDPTAIGEVKSAAQPVKTDNVYYNLKGQRVEKPTKGIYILNGRKVLF